MKSKDLASRIKNHDPSSDVLVIARDVGWFLASSEHDPVEINEITVALCVLIDTVGRDSPKGQMLVVLEMLIGTYYAGLLQVNEKAAAKTYASEDLPQRVLAMFSEEPVLLDDILRRGLSEGVEDIGSVINNLVYYNLLHPLGTKEHLYLYKAGRLND